jgi:hypothetical protein
MMKSTARHGLLTVAALCAAVSTLAAKGPQVADPRKVDADYAVQGEYTGVLQTDQGPYKLGVQVIALGDGAFRAVVYEGGLPGDGWDQTAAERIDSSLVDQTVTFPGPRGVGRIVRDGVMEILTNDGAELGELKRVVRQSPTLGKKPPPGAIVLFDGSSADQWTGTRGGPARMSDGLLEQGANSKRKFQSHRVHIEFRLPYQPQDRGQARGNSGIYPQGRYEVQMLDSFGLEGKNNECGGIYEIRDPDINMCFPPLQWQTYDIDFTKAEFDADGNKTNNAKLTVRHNGVVIHQDVEVPRSTRAAPLPEGPEPGFLHLQDHGNPVRYRNIWVVEGE